MPFKRWFRPRPHPWHRVLGGLLLGGLLLAIFLLPVAKALWQADEQRLHVGLKIFPAVLGALMAPIPGTRDSQTLVLVVSASPSAGATAVTALRRVEDIQGRLLLPHALPPRDMDDYRGPAPYGIFVASPETTPSQLRAWSERHRTLVFSPFEGDVEAGAVAGLHVSDRILPYINLAQARRAGVEFKPFFLKVARIHD